MTMERYIRQLALPEISPEQHKSLGARRVLMVGAGGLGCASLPYVAGAGVGYITIMDDDVVSRSNLHRQTLFKDADVGQSKAELAAAYARDLNSEIEVVALSERLREGADVSGFDLLIDGSDNFETKSLLNALSIEGSVPLVSASVQQFGGQIGVYAGYAKGEPCYHCLFPQLPTDACNCNDAGVLGSSVGIIGTWQAHLILCLLLGLGDVKPGIVMSIDMMNMRMQKLALDKDRACVHCGNARGDYEDFKVECEMSEILSLKELVKSEHVIVDVRTPQEREVDPIQAPDSEIIFMEVSTVPARYKELPEDKVLGFVCAGNVRSAQAADYLSALGYGKPVVLDKFSL
ncbi:MAG: HesA/MoeB/ThiF family protein [Micavibrio sp.]|nr:HesA/MoeB/ThiF family protein [Micavibrio sp.]